MGARHYPSKRQSAIEDLPNEVFSQILSFLDFQNTIVFTRLCSKTLSNRIFQNDLDRDDFHHMWKDSFYRQRFFPPPLAHPTSTSKQNDYHHDYFSLILHRKELLKSTLKTSYNKGYDVPNRLIRFFSFCSNLSRPEDVNMPNREGIIPNNNHIHREMMMEIDFPPIDFVGELFALVDGGVDGEIVCMSPFDGTISVKHLDETFEDSNYEQVLFDIDDYEQDAEKSTDESQVFIDWVGVETKLTQNGYHMVVAARSKERELRNFDVLMNSDTRDNHLDKNWTHLMEVLAWKEMATSDSRSRNQKEFQKYQEKYMCRVGGVPYYIDTCGQFDKVYAAFSPGDIAACSFLGHTPSSILNRVQTNLHHNNLSHNRQTIHHSNTIYLFPLRPSSYFSSTAFVVYPEAEIQCASNIASFAVDSTGENIVIGTDTGTIEIWNTGVKSKELPSKLKTLDFSKRGLDIVIWEDISKINLIENSNSRHDVILDLEEQESHVISEGQSNHLNTEQIQPQLQPVFTRIISNENISQRNPTGNDHIRGDNIDLTEAPSPVFQVILPSHISLLSSSFCAFQSVLHRCTLWQVVNQNSDLSFQQIGAIHFPDLNDAQVNFNGKRLILFGRDRIGFVIYIYFIWGTHEEDAYFQSNSNSLNDNVSPKIYHYVPKGTSLVHKRIQFVNKIRHIGLGGLETFESLILTSNERYIVVNTKNGNLVGGREKGRDGIWVIDLHDVKSFEKKK